MKRHQHDWPNRNQPVVRCGGKPGNVGLITQSSLPFSISNPLAIAWSGWTVGICSMWTSMVGEDDKFCKQWTLRMCTYANETGNFTIHMYIFRTLKCDLACWWWSAGTVSNFDDLIPLKRIILSGSTSRFILWTRWTRDTVSCKARKVDVTQNLRVLSDGLLRFLVGHANMMVSYRTVSDLIAPPI